MEEIVQRTADAMVSEGTPFQGVLFAGLMIKDGKVSPLTHDILGCKKSHHELNSYNFKRCQILFLLNIVSGQPG